MSGERPVLRVVRGDATPEEIAAVVAAVAAVPRAEPVAEPVGAALWGAPGSGRRQIRATFTPSRDGWRTSFWPR